jgi:hypothetical protein
MATGRSVQEGRHKEMAGRTTVFGGRVAVGGHGRCLPHPLRCHVLSAGRRHEEALQSSQQTGQGAPPQGGEAEGCQSIRSHSPSRFSSDWPDRGRSARTRIKRGSPAANGNLECVASHQFSDFFGGIEEPSRTIVTISQITKAMPPSAAKTNKIRICMGGPLELKD